MPKLGSLKEQHFIVLMRTVGVGWGWRTQECLTHVFRALLLAASWGILFLSYMTFLSMCFLFFFFFFIIKEYIMSFFRCRLTSNKVK